MNNRKEGQGRFSRIDGLMLVAAGILAILATIGQGTGGGTEPAVHEGVDLRTALMLVAASLLALFPLARAYMPGDPVRTRTNVVLAAVFVSHLAATLFFFPPEDIANDRPILTLDHPIHYYQVTRAKEVSGGSSRFHAYDPYFMAGYPGGTVFDIDTKGAALWCSVLRFVDTARAFKLFVLAAHLLLALTFYSGCRRFGLKQEESIFALLILLVFWQWGRPYVGNFRYAGMFAYLFVIHISFYLAGLFRTFLEEKKCIHFYILGPLAFFIHPTAAVLLPVPFLALFFSIRKTIPLGGERARWAGRILSRLVFWSALVVLVNLVWLIPLFRYIDIKLPSETFFQIHGISGLLRVIFKAGNLPAIFLLFTAITGFFRMISQGRGTEAAAPAAGAVFFMFVAAFGIYLPLIDQLEPGRFLVPAFVFSSFLSGPGVIYLMEKTGDLARLPGMSRALKRPVLIILIISVPLASLVATREYYRHRLSTTFKPEVEELMRAVRERAGGGGRVMVEDGPAWLYGDSFILSIFPLYTGVEQIGGPYPFAFIKHNFTTLTTGRFMGLPLCDSDNARLVEYIELYNIHWVVTATPGCEERISALAGVRKDWSSGSFTLWETGYNSTFSPDEGVSVRASYDSIRVSLSTRPGEGLPETVLLKYHFDRGLKVDPPATISPEMHLDDPVPFILLHTNGLREVVIYYR